MATYIKIDDKKDHEWMQRLISSLMGRDKNDRFLVTNYEHLMHWQAYLDTATTTKSETIPKTILAEADVEEIYPVKPVTRKAKTATTKKKTAKPAVIINDIFMCVDHPNRTGKQIPRDDCKKCWEIYAKFHPNELEAARRKFDAKQRKKED